VAISELVNRFFRMPIASERNIRGTRGKILRYFGGVKAKSFKIFQDFSAGGRGEDPVS